MSLSKIIDAVKANPVRVMAVISAVLALVAFYVPTLPVALILAIPAAILGIGEQVRARVAPMSRVIVHESDLEGYEDPQVAVFENAGLSWVNPEDVEG